MPYDSIHEGEPVDLGITRAVDARTLVGDPGDDNSLVTERAVRAAIEALALTELAANPPILIKSAPGIDPDILMTPMVAIIDPSSAWVPKGGAGTEMLKKASDENRDTVWEDPIQAAEDALPDAIQAEINAANCAVSAAGSEAAANDSAVGAKAWSETDEDVPVPGTAPAEYSAKHWSIKAASAGPAALNEVTATAPVVVSTPQVGDRHLTIPAAEDILIPAGGTIDQVLAKNSAGDRDVSWKTMIHPTELPAGGVTGQHLGKVDGADYNVQWQSSDVGGIDPSIVGIPMIGNIIGLATKRTASDTVVVYPGSCMDDLNQTQIDLAAETTAYTFDPTNANRVRSIYLCRLTDESVVARTSMDHVNGDAGWTDVCCKRWLGFILMRTGGDGVSPYWQVSDKVILRYVADGQIVDARSDWPEDATGPNLIDFSKWFPVERVREIWLYPGTTGNVYDIKYSNALDDTIEYLGACAVSSTQNDFNAHGRLTDGPDARWVPYHQDLYISPENTAVNLHLGGVKLKLN